MAIVTLSTFKAYARNELGTADDTSIQAALDAAHYSAYQYCARSFEVASVTPSVRYYPGNDTRLLRIHDCTTITSVTIDGSTVGATEYEAQPVNRVDWAGNARPIEQLLRYQYTWDIDQTDPGRANVAVTATWGWAAAPAPAIEAVKVLAKDILHQRDNRSGVAGFGEFGAVRVRQNPYVAMLLDPLRRTESHGIG